MPDIPALVPELIHSMIDPGFIVFLLLVLTVLWGIFCAWPFLMVSPLPRGVDIVAITQLVTTLVYEVVWIDWLIFTEKCLISDNAQSILSDSLRTVITLAAFGICAVGFFATLFMVLCKASRPKILCFCTAVLQSLVYFWSFIAMDAPSHC